MLREMSSENHKLFSFDDVTVDRDNFRVLKAGVMITLTPRAFDVPTFSKTLLKQVRTFKPMPC
jgi:DNA-binding response OmpR family regulator